MAWNAVRILRVLEKENCVFSSRRTLRRVAWIYQTLPRCSIWTCPRTQTRICTGPEDQHAWEKWVAQLYCWKMVNNLSLLVLQISLTLSFSVSEKAMLPPDSCAPYAFTTTTLGR